MAQQSTNNHKLINNGSYYLVFLHLIGFLFYFISFAKNKQTNWKNVGRDTTTAVANYSGPGY